MADHRITSIIRTVTGVVCSAPALLYGAVLSAKSGGASVTLCDFAAATAVPASSRVLPLYHGGATGTTAVLLNPPRQMDAGIFATMGGAGLHVTITYSRRR